MRGTPGLPQPALTFWQYVGIAAVTAVIVPLVVALLGRPRRTPPAVSVPTSFGTTVVLALGRRRWLVFLIALALAAFLPSPVGGRRVPPVNAEPLPPPPAPCGGPVAWHAGSLAAGVVKPPGGKHPGGHRVVVCATAGPGSAWQSTTVDDADDVYTWSGMKVFQDRAVLVGTAGTRMDDGRLAYDAAIWTCRIDAGLSCSRIPDPTSALGGPHDQFIKSAELGPDGQDLVARGGSGRGGVTHERVWVYDGARVTRRE
jgi:hypothetical protein